MAVTQTITVTKTKTLAQPWKNLVTMPIEEQIIDQDIESDNEEQEGSVRLLPSMEVHSLKQESKVRLLPSMEMHSLMKLAGLPPSIE